MLIKEFFGLWQLPLYIALIVAWLWGGGYMLARSLAKVRDVRRVELGKPVLHMLLAGGAALIAMGVFVHLLGAIQEATSSENVRIIGLAPAALASLAVAYAILFAIYEFNFWQTVKITSPAIGAVLLAGLVVGIIVYLPTRPARIENARMLRSQGQVRVIAKAIQTYEERASAQPPKSLSMLTHELTLGGQKVVLLPPQFVVSPFLKNRVPSYFYFPVVSINGRTDKMKVCEYTHDRSSIGRPVMFANGEVRWVPDGEFQIQLARPDNAEFAKAFRAKDSAPPSAWTEE